MMPMNPDAHLLRSRRRLCVQDSRRGAGGCDPRPIGPAAPMFWSDWTTAMTPPWSGRRRPRGALDRRLLHPGRRLALRLGPDRRRQRAVGCVRDGRPAGRHNQSGRLAARSPADGDDDRGAPRRSRCRGGGRLSGDRRTHHRRPGAEIRQGGDRHRRPRQVAAQRCGAGRAAPHP